MKVELKGVTYMVKFLVNRPVAVIMSFIAVIMLGIVSAGRLPVSLMPDIDIPEITVAVSRPDNSAREIENTIVSILRRNLLQVPGLEDIESDSRNGSAILVLRFEYGTDIDLAFMEVNEKIDGSMNMLPTDLERPRIIKASATDIPVFFINLTLKDSSAGDGKFLDLSKFAGSVIKKRIEQLPEVAIADITGQAREEIYIEPDLEVAASLGITEAEIREAVARNNINIGSLMVRDGKYLYNIEFSSYLKTVDDVADIFLKTGDRLIRLGDIAEVGIRQQRPAGIYFNGDNRAITMAIIKKASARMADLKSQIADLMETLQADYPDIGFELSQDQTRILDFSMNNLRQSLLLGGTVAFLVMFFFLRDGRSPWLIGMSVPASVLISILFFHLVGLSINIISLSGLILGVGMMIDNSIIVTDNIVQYMNRGDSVTEACIRGTNEVIRPLLSSILTTCAVFIPLIFLSGVAGAMFYDQAIAISIGLFTSFAVSIMLLPTLFRQMYMRPGEGWLTRLVKRISFKDMENRYESGMRFVFRQRWGMLILFVAMLFLTALLMTTMKKERLPVLPADEMLISIDWNENIDVNENGRRVMELLGSSSDLIVQSNSFVGEQGFIFSREYDQTYTSSRLYVKASGYDAYGLLEEKVRDYLSSRYPEASVTTGQQENIFGKIFSASEADLVVRLSLLTGRESPTPQATVATIGEINERIPGTAITMPPLAEKITIRPDQEKLLLYDVNPQALYNRIRTSLNSNRAGELRASYELLPVMISGEKHYFSQLLDESAVINRQGATIPVRELVSVGREEGYKTIRGGLFGEYVPLEMQHVTGTVDDVTAVVREIVAGEQGLGVRFGGSLVEGQKLFREMLVIILISVLLLYFILASQFESLVLPLIVLLEIPIDIAGALLLLVIFGGTVNLMSMIGIVVMSGIIINDSILKVDTINHLRWSGMELKEAIYTGGARRFKPIIMTSLTTVLAMIPFLFGTDIGSELQRPLALAVIGGMTLGTLVSLYFIPLAYWFLYRNKDDLAISQ